MNKSVFLFHSELFSLSGREVATVVGARVFTGHTGCSSASQTRAARAFADIVTLKPLNLFVFQTASAGDADGSETDVLKGQNPSKGKSVKSSKGGLYSVCD